MRIPIGEIRLAFALLISHEGNRVIIRAEGSAGQRQTKDRFAEGFAQRFAPILTVTGMVQLIEDDESFATAAGAPEHFRRQTDLLIGHNRAVIVTRLAGLLIRERRIELNADLPRRGSPLRSKMIRRADHQDTTRGPIGEILMCDPEREACFPGRRRRGDEIVLARLRQHIGDRPRLPVPQHGFPWCERHRHLNTDPLRRRDSLELSLTPAPSPWIATKCQTPPVPFRNGSPVRGTTETVCLELIW